MPQNLQKSGEFTEEERLANARMIHFNIYHQKPVIIKWFFSKNSTKDSSYRDIAKEAVEIYNRAFQIITKGTDKEGMIRVGISRK